MDEIFLSFHHFWAPQSYKKRFKKVKSTRLKWFTISVAVIMRAVLCGVQFKFNFQIKRYNYFLKEQQQRTTSREKVKEFFCRVVNWLKNPQETPEKKTWEFFVFYARITVRLHFNHVRVFSRRSSTNCKKRNSIKKKFLTIVKHLHVRVTSIAIFKEKHIFESL